MKMLILLYLKPIDKNKKMIWNYMWVLIPLSTRIHFWFFKVIFRHSSEIWSKITLKNIIFRVEKIDQSREQKLRKLSAGIWWCMRRAEWLSPANYVSGNTQYSSNETGSYGHSLVNALIYYMDSVKILAGCQPTRAINRIILPFLSSLLYLLLFCCWNQR